MVNVTIKYNVTEMTQSLYNVTECNPEPKTIKHIKKMPECKNVTKHHCVTKWEVLPSGEKVGISGKLLKIIFRYKLLTKFLSGSF